MIAPSLAMRASRGAAANMPAVLSVMTVWWPPWAARLILPARRAGNLRAGDVAVPCRRPHVIWLCEIGRLAAPPSGGAAEPSQGGADRVYELLPVAAEAVRVLGPDRFDEVEGQADEVCLSVVGLLGVRAAGRPAGAEHAGTFRALHPDELR